MPRVEHSYCREMCRGKEMMRTRFYLLLLFIVASLVVVPEVSAHEAVPVGTWTTTGSMATARYGHTATVLGSGAVLVVGGQSSAGQALATAELYDPTAGTWTTTGSMVTARYGHTATVLNDGRVLVTGGQDKAGHALGKAEIYDPASGTWTATRNMVFAHTFQTATLLNDGKVLVVGGQNERGSVIARAEIYDPASGTWTATSNMIFARMFQTATLLKDGRVLVAGGRDYNGSILTTAEIYDPTSGIWTATRNMNVARSFQTATLLNDGRVLVIGGGARLAEAYDPVAGTWATVGSMSVSRISHTATLLSNGTILVTGGQDNNSQALVTTEIYDPTKASWSLTGSMTAPRWGQTALLLGNGKVLVVGGQDNAGHALATAELFGFADTTAPTLQLPAPLNVNATNAQGATVNYSVTATDPDDTTSQITISCTPASGSVFPVGTTTVNCSAQDAAGNTSTGSFPVVVQDVTAPTLQLPTTITMNATSPQGATVNYAVSATDPTNTAAQIVITCTPLSGSVFPVGATTVDCSAQDPAGNTSTGSFRVIVQDVTAPTLQLPVTITADATSAQGVVVNYTTAATDPTNTPDQLTVNCTPPSGSVFPIGTTTVICDAQDPAGNTTTGSFPITVNPKTVTVNIDAL
jgi:N-acetylneuraminic acid mutarotase